jgi:hypothetical protein
VGERRLAEARRAVEENVVEGLVTLEGRLDGDAQVVFELLLADELVQPPRAQSGVEGLIIVLLEVAGYDAFFSLRGRAPVRITVLFRGNYRRAPTGRSTSRWHGNVQSSAPYNL